MLGLYDEMIHRTEMLVLCDDYEYWHVWGTGPQLLPPVCIGLICVQ